MSQVMFRKQNYPTHTPYQASNRAPNNRIQRMSMRVLWFKVTPVEKK